MTTLTRRWFPRRMPDDTRVRQIYGFCFDSAGRVLLGDESEEGAQCTLPGGAPTWDGFDCLAALTRECREKYGVSITRPIYLGYWKVLGQSPELPDAELFLAARVTTFHRTSVAPTAHRLPDRLLSPISEVADRLGWSEDGPIQVAGSVATSVFGLNPSTARQTLRRA
ncbi:NUDIX hydrolase [Streptomyces sp. CA-135486]|uniref:NUDIX hydrolase n=1 Tax=Streptomyces sp. CA-135486 TaxID=3240049 RepID=UPI003D8CCF6B